MTQALAEFVMERRSEKRRKRSEPVWWKGGARDRKVGWLLERSARGAAFISLGRRVPRIAEPVEFSTWSPETKKWTSVRGYVRRVQRVHGDLFLVGVFCVVDRPRIVKRAAAARQRPAPSPVASPANLQMSPA